MSKPLHIEWVILTQGNREAALEQAIASLDGTSALVVVNGEQSPGMAATSRTLEVGENVGIPAGRDVGFRSTEAPIVGFLDDDAVASPEVSTMILDAFRADDHLGVISLRLVDEHGETSRRHVPRFGGRHTDRGGQVALFLGGACAVRREAYLEAGGYWGELFYGHEEVELAWRLIDRGWRIRYLPDATVFHPRTEIGRHADGWRMTGRNRVMIARRTLPWPVAVVHALAWLGLGVARAPGRQHRRAYLAGWRTGWRVPVDRRPISWRAVWRLTRLGRPPVL